MGGVPTMEEKSKQSSSRGFFSEIIKILLLQVLVLLVANLLYQQVAKVQIELSLSARPAISEKNSIKLKELQNGNSPENKKIAWNEPASAEKALRDYTDFVVTKRPWLLVVDRIAWAVCFLIPAYMILRRIGKADCTDFSETFDGGAFGIGISVGFATFCFVNVAGGFNFLFYRKAAIKSAGSGLDSEFTGKLVFTSMGLTRGQFRCGDRGRDFF